MSLLIARARRLRPSLYVVIAAVSLLLAIASLAYPSAPAYDPWAWIIWGREILHLHLVTTGGPTWKPLPVIFTTLFAPFGSAAPALWLIVARAGAIMAVALAAVLAYRLTARGGDRAGSILAATLAAAGLTLLAGFPDGAALGESEGLLVALMLLAVLRCLHGDRRQAFVLGFGAALVRPEAWPFFALFGIYLWRADPGARRLITISFALTAALWFVPELWGSGTLTRGVQWAQHDRPGSPAFASCPFCSEIAAHAWPLTIAPWKVGIAVLVALAALWRRRWPAPALALAAVGVAWVLEEAVLTQIGFSGSDRYLIAPVALLVVAGAVGWGALLAPARALIAARLTRAWLRPALAGATALAAVAVLLALTVPWRGSHLAGVADTVSEVRYQATLWQDLREAVSDAGGVRRLTSCGAIETNPSEAPLAAWTLGVQMLRTENGDGNVLIQSASSQGSAVQPRPADAGHYRLAARVRDVTILTRCVPDHRVRAAAASGAA